jgi:THO complex subunit 2
LLCYTFWQLSLYDISVPLEGYETEIAKQRQQLQNLEKEALLTRDETALAKLRRRREKERTVQTIEKLENEKNTQEAHVINVEKRLKYEYKQWLPDDLDRNKAVSTILQYCIRPRMLFSDVDALYCARFIFRMHAIGVPNFSSLRLLDRVSLIIDFQEP